MTKAKQTLDKYNQARDEGRSKLQPLFDEKNKKRDALKIVLLQQLGYTCNII